MECLNEIIGLIEDPNECLSLSTESLSGLWIEDTTAGRIPVNQAFYNNELSIEKIIPDAVREAVNQLRIVTAKRLAKNYREHFSTIGFKSDWTNYLSANSGYFYLVLKPKNIRGAIITFTEIKIYLESGLHTGNVTIMKNGVNLYQGLPGDLVKFTTAFDDEIYIYYQTDSRPKNFQHVGCCNKTPTYSGYAHVGSGVVSSLDDLDYTVDSYSQGIELKVNFDCDGFQFLCNLDYVNSVFGIVFAKLVQQIARKNIAYYILTNDKVTSYSMVNKEELRQIMDYLILDIETMLKYLPENYDHSDCYRCTGVYKNEILI